MMDLITENKFKEGEVVRVKVNPILKLVVRRYVERIYYCKIQEDPFRKELVYFESELVPHDIKNFGLVTSERKIKRT